MQHFQTPFFYDLQELTRNAPLMRKYYYIFKSLNLSALPDRNDRIGRTGHSRHAILKAFIIKHLERIKSVPQLIEYLNSTPPPAEMCGFGLGVLPDESQFYRFLKNTKNSTLKAIHKTANDLLIKNGLLSLDEFILDSKPMQTATKENNFKNPSRNTTNKAKRPKRNPRATLRILCLKTGSKALSYIKTTFFIVNFTFIVEGHLLFDFIRRKSIHFAEALYIICVSYTIF